MISDLRTLFWRAKESFTFYPSAAAWLLLLAFSLATAKAFPPAPHHIIHGTVRDEIGEPLSLTSAQVFLETTNGIVITCQVSPDIRPGENYRLIIPMDSLIAPDAYKATALKSTMPFRLKVKIGTATYLPLEMVGNLSALGQPAGETLINLTLGVDSDGDGLPDAWEYLILQMMGGGNLSGINPNGVAPNGMTYIANYIAGTYAWDPQDNLKLSYIKRPGQGPVVQFYGVGGRTYSLLGSTNFVHWTPLSVRVPPGNASDPGALDYFNSTSQILEAEVLPSPGQTNVMFFRVRVR